MKILLLAIFIITASLPATAQKFHITDSANLWYITGVDSSGQTFWTYYYNVPIGDNPPYILLQESSSSTILPGSSYIDGYAYIREDTIAGIVYIYDNFLGYEKVLYKYNVSIGDTVHLGYGTYLETDIGHIDTMIDSVINIDSVLINGLYYKVFSLVEIDTNNIHFASYNPYLTYIEGIGSVFDPVNSQLTAMYVGDTIFLQCFQSRGIYSYTINVPFTYPVPGDTARFVNDCAKLGVTSAISNEEVTLFPDPATDNVTIQGVQGCEVCIVNIMGKEVKRMNCINDKEVVQIADLISGVYIVQITNSSGVVQNMRLVKL